jgi:hypothetical protein
MNMDKVKQFLRDLNNPEQYGWAVSPEVRKVALNLLVELDKGSDVTYSTVNVLKYHMETMHYEK